MNRGPNCIITKNVNNHIRAMLRPITGGTLPCNGGAIKGHSIKAFV